MSNSLDPDLSKLLSKVINRQQKSPLARKELTLYLKEMPFNTLANRADPDQAALVRAA